MEDELDIWDQPREKTPKKAVVDSATGAPSVAGVGNFIKYNNTIPIVLGILVLSTSGALAASPAVRDSVFSSTQSVTSIDNSYLLSVNLDSFPFSITVTNVKEDTDSYYVSYTLHTIDLVNSVWQPTDKPLVLEVDKDALKGDTLGIYVSEQLAQVKDNEKARFTIAQDAERKKGQSQKVVATEYHGLVGSFLGSHDEAIPGYEQPATVLGQQSGGVDPNHLDTPQAVPTSDGSQPPSQTASVSDAVAPSSSSSGSFVNNGDHEAPVVQVLGDSSVTVTVGGSYQDMGVLVSDNVNPAPTPDLYVDGKPVKSVSIDTSVAGSHTIMYLAQDAAGNHAQAQRTVTVVAGSTGGGDSTPPATTPDPTPAPTTPAPTPDQSAPAPAPDAGTPPAS